MRVVIAPDSFKGSIPAAAAAEALADGWRSAASARPTPEIELRPMADGGEGTLEAFAAAVPGARRMPVRATGPDGAEHDAHWLRLPATAESPDGIGVVELASTSGIELLGDRRRPWDADTTGFGQAIRAALDAGVSRLVLGIGSSASTDGGTGILRSLGARFLDDHGDPVPPGARGLRMLASVDLSHLRPTPPGGVLVIADVRSPLVGPRGAAAVFGPQKGFRDAELAEVDAGLNRLAALIGGDPALPGAGAAGGAGFALARWSAQLTPGAAEVAELIGLPDAIAGASLVITGEGRYDGQSADGKAPAHVAALARSAGVPVALVAGQIAPDAPVAAYAESIDLSVLAGGASAALADPARWLRAAGAALARQF